ncbi:YkgJ family cysteine cluster protein [Thermosulfurimonas marina]|uniref:YkgJ family cysteine cluster protein n=1 Tax=Thermosulfurimonas marina TaxID=2047767 RepID=A0A6H1WQE5_9BACT|nr:YkgJ family cysteine cluster protein [Thermosulfurimonas marina]QJA05384.1 YkgJ family cysteine cluster protein [Thermosulfurimonas marina]
MKALFECRRCGYCCQGESTVSLSPQERERIAAFLGLSLEELFQRYLVKKGKRVEMRTVEGHCIFYDPQEGLCRIHPVKPDRCRQWPLHPSILKDPENFEIIRASCPGFREDVRWEDLCKALKSEQTS